VKVPQGGVKETSELLEREKRVIEQLERKGAWKRKHAVA